MAKKDLGNVAFSVAHRELRLTHLRRTAALFVVLLATSCHFSFDRDLAPGDLQGRVLVASSGGTTQTFVPANGAWVKLAASGLALQTDANGRFVIRGLGAGSYGLNITFDEDGRTVGLLSLKGVTISEGGARDLGDLKLGATGALEGTVLLDGEPLGNVALQVLDGDGQASAIPPTTSDMAGHYELAYAPAGDIRVRGIFTPSSGGGQVMSAVSAPVQVVPRTTTHADLTLTSPQPEPPANLRIHVATPPGVALPSTVTVILTPPIGASLTYAQLHWQDAQISDIPPGIYTPTIVAPHFVVLALDPQIIVGSMVIGDMLLLPLSASQDQCATDNGGCDVQADCMANEEGSAVCVCHSGYSGDGRNCEDVDECVTDNGGCDPLTVCTNNVGAFECGACPAGFTGNGATGCVDVDECLSENGGCDPLTVCTNSPGAFSCSACPSGYKGTAFTGCVDVDECLTDRGGCDLLTVCANSPGSFSCSACPTGYSGTGLAGCADVDECQANNGDCDMLTTCTNSVGSFACGECPLGFTGTGATGCEDVDECLVETGCDALAGCINDPGTFHCGECPTGYSGTGATGCFDIDECETNTSGCDESAICVNTVGSFTCTCYDGYTGDGFHCLSCADPANNCQSCEDAPQFCEEHGVNCAIVIDIDICGHLYKADCGTCAPGQICGLTTANVCQSTGIFTVNTTVSALNVGGATSTTTFGKAMATSAPVGVMNIGGSTASAAESLATTVSTGVTVTNAAAFGTGVPATDGHPVSNIFVAGLTVLNRMLWGTGPGTQVQQAVVISTSVSVDSTDLAGEAPPNASFAAPVSVSNQ